jgi:hypothetical protein
MNGSEERQSSCTVLPLPLLLLRPYDGALGLFPEVAVVVRFDLHLLPS